MVKCHTYFQKCLRVLIVFDVNTFLDLGHPGGGRGTPRTATTPWPWPWKNRGRSMKSQGQFEKNIQILYVLDFLKVFPKLKKLYEDK